MVIKNARKIECLSVSYKYAVTVCKPYLEKSLNNSNKIYQVQGFLIIAISENASKYDVSDSKLDTYLGVPLQKIWIL